MLIGILSEIHLQESLGIAGPHSMWGTTRLAEIVESVLYAFDKFKEEGVKFIIHGGDFIDAKNSVPITVLEAYGHLLRKAPASIVDVVSNHGASDREGQHHIASVFALHQWQPVADWSYCIANTAVPQGFNTKSKTDSVAVFGIPFCADIDIKKFYADCKKLTTNFKETYAGKYNTNIIIIHQGVKEAKLSNAPFQLEKNISGKKLIDYFKWADLIVAGHYHDPQKLHKRLLIPGAICQHNFKDCGGKRGFWIYDTETRETTFYASKAPRFHQIDYEKQVRSLGKGQTLPTGVSAADYVRVFIKGAGELKTTQKRLKGINLSFRVKPEDTTQELRDSTMSFSLNDFDLLVKYIENKKPSELSPKTLKKFGKKIIDLAKKEADDGDKG